MLSINKKRRNLKLVGVVVFCVCCPQVPCCFCHILFVLVTLRCTEQELRRSVLFGPVDWGRGRGGGGLRSAECPPLPLSSCCLLVVLQLLLTALSSCWIDVTLLLPPPPLPHHHPYPDFFFFWIDPRKK